ncbi:MAG: RimK family alpha-L-glutamate ligase [Deltaproteobacteria bacterium]|nr:RimK family alpha-L-glutamate ligase [Deltaproteobacteria bacterium]
MEKKVALEHRLRRCKNVITLGVRPNFSDYKDWEQELIRNSSVIYYPTVFYADIFDTIGKRTFPTYHTYKFTQDKIKQTTLFRLLDIPHPKTRFFYGNRQKGSIPDRFQFPLIGKIPRGSAFGKGVYLIRDKQELADYIQLTHVAYIQEYLEFDRDLRVVIMGNRIIHAYWRIAPEGDFRTNVSQGGEISFDNIPEEGLDLALNTARQCRFDDVGLDICFARGRYWVLEANMKYGKKGFKKAGINYYQLVDEMIDRGEL